MRTYCVRLAVKTGVLTPFQADTLFGHICWVIAYQEGEKALQEFLQLFAGGGPPFVLSDGFPKNFLPKPLSAEVLAPEDKQKEIKKIEYVSPEDFSLVTKGKTFEPKLLLEDFIRKTTSTHNTISRLTNTTMEEIGVYTLPEMIVPEVSIYLKVVSEEWKDRVIRWLKELSNSGFGRKKSIGKGQFSVAEVSDQVPFEKVEDADGFVTLSNFCPAEDDPVEGLYKTFVKYGKLGEEFTFCGNPFKKPLVMIKTGSVFKTAGPPKEFYGRMVDEIAPAKGTDVVQYAYAFAVRIKYPD